MRPATRSFDAWRPRSRRPDGPTSSAPSSSDCQPGSRHEIGALAFATAARRRGIGVVYLGADVTHDSWIDAAHVTNARGVVIGIPTAGDRGPGRQVAETMVHSGGWLVAAGGAGALDADLPAEVLQLPNGIVSSTAALQQALADR